MVTSLQCVQFCISIQSNVNILKLSHCYKDALGMDFEGLPILTLDNILRRVNGRTHQPGEMATSKQQSNEDFPVCSISWLLLHWLGYSVHEKGTGRCMDRIYHGQSWATYALRYCKRIIRMEQEEILHTQRSCLQGLPKIPKTVTCLG